MCWDSHIDQMNRYQQYLQKGCFKEGFIENATNFIEKFFGNTVIVEFSFDCKMI